jgi:hypothetical protein
MAYKISKEANYGTEFIFERGVALYDGGTTLRAVHVKSNMCFETTDNTGIYDDATWFEPKNILLTLDYDTDTLIITKKSSGKQIRLTPSEYYTGKYPEARKYYDKYLEEKNNDLKHQKEYDPKQYYKKHADMITKFIDDIYDTQKSNSPLLNYIDPLYSLLKDLER